MNLEEPPLPNLADRLIKASFYLLRQKILQSQNVPFPPSGKLSAVFLIWLDIIEIFADILPFFLLLSVVHPLTHLLSPKADFVWSPERQYAFEKFKSLLLMLQPFPIFLGPLKLEVVFVCVVAILQEDASGADHPVSYFSCKVNKHQIKYSRSEKETLALLLAFQQFEVYLGSISLPVVTAHNLLTFLSLVCIIRTKASKKVGSRCCMVGLINSCVCL